MTVPVWLCVGGLCALLLFVAYRLLKPLAVLRDSTVIVEGRALPFVVSKKKVEKLRTEFQVRRDDVFIVSYPKSGTTWVQQIVRLVRAKGAVGDNAAKISDAIPWLEGSEVPAFGCNVTLEDLESRQGPRTFKTHLPCDMIPGVPLGRSPAKYIYVARNPKDTAVSLYTFANQLFKLAVGFSPLTWSSFLGRFLGGSMWYGDWCEHVLGWWGCRHEPNVLFLKYEDMQKDLPAVVRRVAGFLEQDLEDNIVESIASRCTFKSMQSNSTSNYVWATQNLSDHLKLKYPFLVRLHGKGASNRQTKFMMRKGVVGDWKNYFTAQQSIEFDRAYSEKTKCVGLCFDEQIKGL